MPRLTIDRAPPPGLPRRFLLTAPCWGVAGGILLLADGDALLHTRWLPATVALVHMFTLGVLGNVMFGSVLQFLPAAAGVRVRGGVRAGHALHALLNGGTLLLVASLLARWRQGLCAAGLVLPLAFALLGTMTLPGMLHAAGQRLLRAGIGTALAFAMGTALLGGGLAFGLGDSLDVPLTTLADVHASWGVLGWIVLLLASVARVVMPMFQGTAGMPAALQWGWSAGVVLALLGVGWLCLAYGAPGALRVSVAALGLLFAAAALWLQWRAPRRRSGPLLWSWCAGLLMLALAAAALLADVRGGLLAAALGLGIALPLLVEGMLLEIAAFLGWIELHRRIGRGRQLPGVQRLLPVRTRSYALLAHLPLALLLPAAVLYPSPWLARPAGAAMVLAWLGPLAALHGLRRRRTQFLRQVRAEASPARVPAAAD